MNQELIWYTARASGIVTWVLVTAAIVLGLLLSQRPLPQTRPAWILDLHRFLAALGLAFLAVHLGALALDTYVGFGWAELLVPLASPWRPGAVAWGIVACYLLVAVEITSLAMRRLGKRLWHAIHLSSFAVFLAATVHALEAGTDGHAIVLRGFAIGASTAIALLAVVRIARGKRARARHQVAPGAVYAPGYAVGVPDGARGWSEPDLAQRVLGDPRAPGARRVGGGRDGAVGIGSR